MSNYLHKYINIGNEGFKNIRNDIYVDKSGLIDVVNRTLNTYSMLTCISRPRRFGKSFAAKMLTAYYDKTCDSSKLFDDLEIASKPSYRRHLNKYNVIYLDITQFISRFRSDIDNLIDYKKTELIDEIEVIFPTVEIGKELVDTLYNVVSLTGEKIIVIIDEWDAIFREAEFNHKLQEAYIDLLRSLFKSSWTDNMFCGVYITGILPMKRYGNQSAVSSFNEYTMLMPGPFAKYIGFTNEEVSDLANEFNMNFETLKYWYDGYSLNEIQSIYSPNSVIQSIKYQQYGSFWTRTETYESLKYYIEMDFDGLKQEIIRMLAGEHVPVSTGAFQNDLTSILSKNDVLTLLIHLGYLAYDRDAEEAYIPNEEVKKEFILAVSNSTHPEFSELLKRSNRILKATISKDEKEVANQIQQIQDFISTPLSYNSEADLRSVIRCAYLSSDTFYSREEELPAARGFADIIFRPKATSHKPLLVVELKWNKTPDIAINQIKNHEYYKAIRNYSGTCLLIGINYDVKTKMHTCKIEEIQVNL